MAMPPKRTPEQPDEMALEMLAMNDRLDQMIRDTQLSSRSRDEHVIALEHRFQGAEAGIHDLRNQSEMLRTSVDGIQTLLRDLAARLPEKQGDGRPLLRSLRMEGAVRIERLMIRGSICQGLTFPPLMATRLLAG